jgi:hypothetical protein
MPPWVSMEWKKTQVSGIIATGQDATATFQGMKKRMQTWPTFNTHTNIQAVYDIEAGKYEEMVVYWPKKAGEEGVRRNYIA